MIALGRAAPLPRAPSTTKQPATDLKADAKKAYGFDATAKPTGRKKIFDDAFLDELFPKKQTYHETAPKRKAGDRPRPRGFAHTHGTKVDESGSEDEDM
ncbi:hypothetical protein LTR36_009266 [Oleoguttula mirabilis]|uniref:Uncharacterized protein n=1 Tax=Oleoguttula mirabilis TaxID=1507867 RepID=A0AAV9J5U0_9PEZI|nr:hypothetical protein LTR36_009266 [Oleoguttula mirabilis]